MSSAPTSDEILPRVQHILRRDLKLGADAQIPPDMAFFGGNVDLDSLDILLLVTSIEKEFGVKIPSSEIGKEVFQNVATLANYVAKNLTNGARTGGAGAGATTSVTQDFFERLPHREPFRFISRVTRVGDGDAEGVWALSGSEPFFAGHFPGNPLVPGVLIAEALAQISGLAAPATDARGGMLAHADVRFAKPVSPPAEIVLRSKHARTMGSLQQFEVSARVGETIVASGSITLHRGGDAGRG